MSAEDYRLPGMKLDNSAYVYTRDDGPGVALYACDNHGDDPAVLSLDDVYRLRSWLSAWLVKRIPPSPQARLDREDCVKYGGHCWAESGMRLSTGYTTTQQQTCKHCGYTRTGVSREPWEWTYPD